AKRKCQGGAKPLEIASPLTRVRNDVLSLYFLISEQLYCEGSWITADKRFVPEAIPVKIILH
ncbi:MAG: hypothetical protein FWD82_07025, partial [Defluviitaleaceae bacterium]|nr:hypothetical protein [Defluviitaleaceae bacterium]